MTDQELQQLVEEISMRDFRKPFRHIATFNARLRTTGGRYMLADHRIEINPKYILAFESQELVGIIRHELCHYHLHLEGKGYRHQDLDFKRLLEEVGAPRFCRALPTERPFVKKKIHLYICLKCGHNYSRKIRMNTDKFRCGKCWGTLQYRGEKNKGKYL
ncbi:SprT family protein [Chryseomicrobium palamuruense]|uniref:Protein SprT-like n=1 Tax=Chryseomicrobium palamuruense TaxID=682973 RepID=A0ABV8UU22_9BACL